VGPTSGPVRDGSENDCIEVDFPEWRLWPLAPLKLPTVSPNHSRHQALGENANFEQTDYWNRESHSMTKDLHGEMPETSCGRVKSRPKGLPRRLVRRSPTGEGGSCAAAKAGWSPACPPELEVRRRKRRARQAALICRWAPWRRSTGPKTEAGKTRCLSRRSLGEGGRKERPSSCALYPQTSACPLRLALCPPWRATRRRKRAG